MDQLEETEFDQEAKMILDCMNSMKKDSEFFIEKGKKGDSKFSLEKEDDEISENEREIRWHNNVGKIIDRLIAWRLQDQRKNSEILELKEQLNQKTQELKNIKTDFITQKSVLLDQITVLTETVNKNFDAFLKFRDKTENDIIDLHTDYGSGDLNKNLHSTAHQFPQVKVKPPTFSGNKNERPMQFLTELKKYIEVMHISDSSLITILQQSLTNNASSWFYTIEHNIEEFIDFEVAFLERYWNEPIKSALRTKLAAESWSPDKKISRVEYAQQLIGIIKQLEMNLNEFEKMKLIARHFDDDIARTIRLQGICTTGNLYDLLQDYDKREEKNFNLLKKNNQTMGAIPKEKGNY